MAAIFYRQGHLAPISALPRVHAAARRRLARSGERQDIRGTLLPAVPHWRFRLRDRMYRPVGRLRIHLSSAIRSTRPEDPSPSMRATGRRGSSRSVSATAALGRSSDIPTGAQSGRRVGGAGSKFLAARPSTCSVISGAARLQTDGRTRHHLRRQVGHPLPASDVLIGLRLDRKRLHAVDPRLAGGASDRWTRSNGATILHLFPGARRQSGTRAGRCRVPLMANRSLAVDRLLPFSTPFYIDAARHGTRRKPFDG